MASPAAVEAQWGAVARMRFIGPGPNDWTIVSWNHPTLPEPNRAQLTAAQTAYDARDVRAEQVNTSILRDPVFKALLKVIAADNSEALPQLIGRLRAQVEL